MEGGVHGRGCAWWGDMHDGVCGRGDMHGVGCMAGGGMCGRGHAGQGVHGQGDFMHGRGACMAGETATAVGGTYPAVMHSCVVRGHTTAQCQVFCG